LLGKEEKGVYNKNQRRLTMFLPGTERKKKCQTLENRFDRRGTRREQLGHGGLRSRDSFLR